MSTKKTLIIATTVVLLGLLSVGIYYAATKSTTTTAREQPKEVGAAFILALTNAELSKTREFGSSFYKSKNTLDNIEKFSDSVRSDDVKISNEELYLGTGDDRNKAIYLALADGLPPSSSGSKSGTFVVRLVNEDGLWKVDSLEVK